MKRVKPNFRVRVHDGVKWLLSCDLRYRPALVTGRDHARSGRRAQLVDAFGNCSADIPADVPSNENWWRPMDP